MKKVWKKISGWGAYPIIKAEAWEPTSIKEIQEIVFQKETLLARGSGSSYGDSSLNKIVISTKKLDKIIAEANTWIEVEAGITIEKILSHIVPQQKFLAVTPGTQSVTIGGAIASDVHGKNHCSAGSFFNVTESLKLVNEKGEILQCSRQENEQLFYKCFGGMGMQGIIVTAVIRLTPLPANNILERQYIVHSLPEIFLLMQQHRDAPYLVGWLDLLGKKTSGIVKTGEWNVTVTPLKKSCRFKIPFVLPMAPPRFLFKWYNKRYLAKAKKHPVHTISFSQFFFPLDSIINWRYAFGKKGLLQYHFVLPLHLSETGITDVVELTKKSGAICTLAVLKVFGKANNETPYSFAREGYNLALDFIRTPKAVALIHVLDEKIQALGGQIYKAKDAVSQLPMPLESSKFQSLQNQRYGLT